MDFVAKLSCATVAFLAASGQAQDQVAIEDKVFLTATHAESGIINYIEMYEHHEKANHLQTMDGAEWKPLVTGLKYPTYTAYDFEKQLLFVCDCDEIIKYGISFANSNGEDLIYSVKEGSIISNVDCGGLAIDKFHNLFYVDRELSQINKVNWATVYLNNEPTSAIRTVYSGDRASAAKAVEDINIEHEYLYWTNDSHEDGRGGIHKAFTEPFIKPEPFQTYEVKDVTNAKSVTTNENYLFYTGLYEEPFSAHDIVTNLFIQKKQGAGLYYHFGAKQTDKLNKPGALLTYKDTLLLVANEGFISMLDMTKFPPLPQDFLDYQIPITQAEPFTPNNSVCAVKRPVDADRKQAANGMSFITMNSETVNAKTLFNAAQSSLVTTLSSVAIAGLLLAF